MGWRGTISCTMLEHGPSDIRLFKDGPKYGLRRNTFKSFFYDTVKTK